jgi:ATP-dependent Clp protease adaptor protein ClpS
MADETVTHGDLAGEEPDVGVIDGITTAAKVILFNDEVHTFDDVINQLVKALNCTVEKAESLTWEVHTNGKACVYNGELHDCLKVSSVLEEIALHTQIEY